MAAAIALGGFTGPEADTLGYAIRKKKSSVLRAQKEKFVTQAAERGVAPQVIDAVFTAFEPFERYGFNKAHATCYGLIAYQTAYLKANYTVEYMTERPDGVPVERGEGRRRGRRVPPDGHRGPAAGRPPQPASSSPSRARRSGSGCWRSRTSARARSSRSSPRARRAARSGRSPTSARGSTCGSANRKVLESLARVGALNAFGHPAQILLGLDDAIAAGQAAQRDRITGQTSLFDMGADGRRRPRAAAAAGDRGAGPRAAPLGEGAARALPLGAPDGRGRRRRSADYVTAYSGDLKDESLDGQRVVVGGIVTGFRTVITKANATMGVATLEDLQGSIEVVVFPQLYEQTGPTWPEGAILLVAGRVDHRGEEVSLLADLVVEWDEAVAQGPEAFAREVAAGDRGRGPRRQPVAVGPGAAAPVNGNGSGAANGNGATRQWPRRRRRPRRRPAREIPYVVAAPRRVPPGRAGAERPGSRRDRHGRAVRRPRRPPTAPLGSPRPSRSRPTSEPAGLDAPRRRDRRRRAGAARRGARPGRRAAPRPDAAARPSARPDPPRPVRAAPAADRLVGAMEAFKGLLGERPGRDPRRAPRPGPDGRRVAADGAAPRRRLRRRAARRGPAPARRGDRRAQPRLSAAAVAVRPRR